MATAADLYSPFQFFVIEANTQFEQDFEDLKSQGLVKIDDDLTKKYDKFLEIFQKFIAIRGEYRIHRDEIVYLTEPFQITLRTVLFRPLNYAPNVIDITLAYCGETLGERERIEKTYQETQSSTSYLQLAAPITLSTTGLVILAPTAMGILGRIALKREQAMKSTLAKKVVARTSSTVLLRLQALFYNLKANQKR
jgi:hypothetical protein